MICQQCDKKNDSDAVFCVQCSQPLVKSCPSCSTRNPGDARFCKKCRAELGDASTTAQTTKLQDLRDSAPKGLHEKLQSAGSEIEGQRKPVTILFADIVGSTAIAEKLDPEEWKEVVQGTHHRLSEAIHHYEGTIAQLLGDGVLAFFGAPITHEDDPERAVRAALDLQESIADYRRQLAGLVDDFHMRVGIHAGEVVVGPVGTDEHAEYLAIGDAVNVAARLEGAAQPGQVLISETCARLIEHAFKLGELKPVKAKGKSEPVLAAVVLGLEAEPGLARGIVGVRTPFVGREAEVAQLEGTLLALCQGQGQIVALLGDAGIGKTRLLEHVRETIRSAETTAHVTHFAPASIRWLGSRALSYGGSLSFWTINQLLLDDLGLADGAPQVKIKAALRGRLLEFFGEEEASNVLPYLAHLLGLTLEGDEGELIQRMDGEAIKYQTLTYLSDYFERLAADAPTVLVLEDLHWADPSSLEALERLLPLTDRAALMLVLLMRVDRQHDSWAMKTSAEQDFPHRTTEISLHQLGGEESRSMIEQLIGTGGFPDEIREVILSRSEGNPFYLEEIVHHMLEQGLITEVDGQWSAAGEIGAFGIPDSLQALLLARIDRLEEDVRATLQMASVIGKNFLFKLLQAIAEAERNLESHLSLLQRVDLVREKTRLPELEYMFKHSLTQEAAYKSLLVGRRKAFHRKVGEALEQLFPDREEEFLGLLAHHFKAAGNVEKATDYLIRAGDKARLADADDEAIDLYESVLPLLKEQDEERAHQTLLKIGLSHLINYRFEAANKAYERASQIKLWDRDQEFRIVRSIKEDKTTARVFQLPESSVWSTTFDPGKSHGVKPSIRAVFLGLARVSPTFNIEPYAARSWTVSEGGTRYVFHLREDICWSNGKPLTANEFEWTWLRNLSPQTRSPYAYLLDDIVGAREFRMGESEDPKSVGICALDPTTLEVRLTSPSSYFLYITATPPTLALPRDIIEEFGDAWWHPENIVCAGPFIPRQFDHDVNIFERNKAYSLPFPGNVGRIILRTIESQSMDQFYEQSLSMYQAGEIDSMKLPSNIIPSGIHGNVFSERGDGHTYYFQLNPMLEPLDDLLVRKALTKSIDRTDLTFTFRWRSPAMGGLVHPSIPGHSPDIGHTNDVEDARIALADAGYPDGKGLPEILITSLPGFFKEIAFELQSQWEKNLGIRSRVIDRETAAGGASVHINVGGWIPEYPDPDSYLRRSFVTALIERSGYSNPNLNQLLKEASESTDRRNRLSLYREIDCLLVHDECIFYPLTYGASGHYLARFSIKNFDTDFSHFESVVIED